MISIQKERHITSWISNIHRHRINAIPIYILRLQNPSPSIDRRRGEAGGRREQHSKKNKQTTGVTSKKRENNSTGTILRIVYVYRLMGMDLTCRHHPHIIPKHTSPCYTTDALESVVSFCRVLIPSSVIRPFRVDGMHPPLN